MSPALKRRRVRVMFTPADVATILAAKGYGTRELAKVLARHRVSISHASLNQWASGKSDPGFYRWVAIDAALQKEFGAEFGLVESGADHG